MCPHEQDLAWSEDDQSFYEKAVEAETNSLATHSSMTILKPNLSFGPQSHLIHFLAQCAIVGKCPYKNLVAKEAFY